MSVIVTIKKSTKDCYSMGMHGLDERRKWEIEDAGGFDMVTIGGEVELPDHNGKKYDEESLHTLLEDMNKRMSGDSFPVVTEIEPDCRINLDKVYGQVTDAAVGDGKLYAKITLLDTVNGRLTNDILKSSLKGSVKLVADIAPVSGIPLNIRVDLGE